MKLKIKVHQEIWQVVQEQRLIGSIGSHQLILLK